MTIEDKCTMPTCYRACDLIATPSFARPSRKEDKDMVDHVKHDRTSALAVVAKETILIA